MKNKSLIFKITVWFSAAVIIISGAAVFVTLAIGRAVLQRGIRENLIETVEKAAQIYMLTEGHKRLNLITDKQLKDIADYFGVTPKAGILK